MLFNSLDFAVFFVVVVAAYYGLQHRLRLQNLLLLAASYFFYGYWDWRFLSLVAISTLVDYGCGLLLDKRPEDPRFAERTRRLILLASLVANLGLLGVFKYYDFFAASAAALLEGLGIPANPKLLAVILPVGISFYTFQTLSYTIDVYRGEMRAERSLVNFALFVALFPQLVAGPIVRARDLLPQIAVPRRPSAAQVQNGGYLILWGLFKKIVLAGNLAPIVDEVFASTTPSGGAVLVALYAFALQIYCDFSGYADVARGTAKILGFEFCLNFNLPYFATNPSDFWRRWHISLSTWLRDYLYIPLGGNRKGPRRTLINLMLTMVLGGLWHGAAWTFVLWGFYQGLLLVAHRLAMPAIERLARLCPAWRRSAGKPIAIAAFFHLVCLGWLLFRAESVGQVIAMGQAMLHGISLHGTGVRTLLFYAAPLVIVQMAQYLCKDLDVVLRLSAPVRGMAYATMFYGIVLLGEGFDEPFVYFQF